MLTMINCGLYIDLSTVGALEMDFELEGDKSAGGPVSIWIRAKTGIVITNRRFADMTAAKTFMDDLAEQVNRLQAALGVSVSTPHYTMWNAEMLAAYQKAANGNFQETTNPPTA